LSDPSLSFVLRDDPTVVDGLNAATDLLADVEVVLDILQRAVFG